MKRLLTVLFVLMIASVSVFAQMTDEQVVGYVKSGLSTGKSQDQISKELIAKGVTADQVERIRSKVMSSKSSSANQDGASSSDDVRRSSVKDVESTSRLNALEMAEKKQSFEGGNYPYDPANKPKIPADEIYGHDIFNGKDLSFEPNENSATPESYKLGAGDKILIEIWGSNEASIQRTISPEGRISISQIGPIQLGGLSIKAASEKIRKALASKYAGLGGESTQVSVTLSQIRTIQVNVMGEVMTPGTYRISSLGTVFHALYCAGGITDTGSLRAIKVVRGDEVFAEVDVYGYLFDGKSDTDIALQDGDVIVVPAYQNLVHVSGSVKRPMTYELSKEESLGNLIDYAGGYASNAYKDDIQVIRQTGKEKSVHTVKSALAESFLMNDGDSVFVDKTLDRYSNMVEVKGSVFHPGKYQIGEDIATVKQLITRAGGLTEDAFKGRAIILREQDDKTHETIPVNVASIMSGSSEDILLKKNDVLTVSDISVIEDKGKLSINGFVVMPGEYDYADNTTVEDLILMAGGLLDGASTVKVDVARRIKDSSSLQTSDMLSQSFSFGLSENLQIIGGGQFYLEPYDVVSIRKSPSYQPQKYVTISGEVAFPGKYVIQGEGERISDIIKRAGGLTSHAYSESARLTRTTSNDMSYLSKALKRTAKNVSEETDSLAVKDVDLDQFNVAVHLDKAIANPGSEYDVVIQDDDEIVVPKFENTIRIDGEVMCPTAISYQNNMSVRRCVNAAGGFTERAKRNKTYIIYADGSAMKRSHGGAVVKPGSVILVPARKTTDKMSTAERISTVSSLTSLGTMMTALITLLR